MSGCAKLRLATSLDRRGPPLRHRKQVTRHLPALGQAELGFLPDRQGGYNSGMEAAVPLDLVGRPENHSAAAPQDDFHRLSDPRQPRSDAPAGQVIHLQRAPADSRNPDSPPARRRCTRAGFGWFDSCALQPSPIRLEAELFQAAGSTVEQGKDGLGTDHRGIRPIGLSGQGMHHDPSIPVTLEGVPDIHPLDEHQQWVPAIFALLPATATVGVPHSSRGRFSSRIEAFGLASSQLAEQLLQGVMIDGFDDVMIEARLL